LSRVLIEGTGGRLEAELLEGQEGCGVVLCHPHPQYGGRMDDLVVNALESAFRSRDMTTCRFNFRGVGESEGQFDQGRGEVDDVLAVVRFLRKERQCDRIILAGYSFGACMALMAGQTASPELMVLVAPPAMMIDGCELPAVPTLVMLGESDSIVDAEMTAQWFKSSPTEVIQIPGADHFFFGNHDLLTRHARTFIEVQA
jgi:alpha/beta superfamily hydrolase